MAPRLFDVALLASIFLTGFVAFGYELALSGAAITIIGSSQVAMALVLSTFILGYMTGRPLGKLSDRLPLSRNLALFAALELCVAVVLLCTLPLVRAAPDLASGLGALWPLTHASEYARILLVLGAVALLAPALMGGEIPLAVKMASQRQGEGAAASRIGATTGTVWAADALGAATGGLAAGLWLLPWLGKAQTMTLLAALAVVAALLPLAALALERRARGQGRASGRVWRRPSRGLVAGGALVAVGAVALASVALSPASLQHAYEGRVVHAEQSRYQEIVVTDHPVLGRTLWLDGQLQTSELDEHQYHEPLVHVPAAALGPSMRRAAVLGGGDGGALRQVLAYPSVERVWLVELDERVPDVVRKWLPSVPDGAYDDARATLVIDDAWRWLRAQPDASLDLVVVDMPDPTSDAIALLYTREFYATVRAKMAPGGVMVTQAASPFQSPDVTASVRATVADVFGDADMHEAMVWSFGDWAFVSARKDAPPVSATPQANVDASFAALTRAPEWYRPAFFGALFAYGEDPAVAAAPSRVATVDRPVLVNEWAARAPEGANGAPAWSLALAGALAAGAAAWLVVRRMRREADIAR